jgi:drug/metabolite transporter (DMT)-like permease
LLSGLALPFFFFADSTILDVSLDNILVLSVVGILNALVLLCYLKALENEEASVTIIFYQLVPVFGGILGYFILGETLTRLELLAMAIIIFGTSLVSFEMDIENKFKLRKKTVIPMLAAAFFWALESVLFKGVALEENTWRSLFWEHLVLFLVGVVILLVKKNYRKHFVLAIKKNSKAILSLNVANEMIYIIGNVVFAFAYLLAPISLVLLTESFQPIFVLAIGVFLTIFFPRIAVEKIKTRHLLTKIVAILITGIGAYLLFI